MSRARNAQSRRTRRKKGAVRRGHFATTSSFTPDAARFAHENGIHLLDIEAILRLIEKRPGTDQQRLLAVATEGEYWKPTCVNCGVKLVERKPQGGGTPFWGCPDYPRCRTTMPMRADRRPGDAAAQRAS